MELQHWKVKKNGLDMWEQLKEKLKTLTKYEQENHQEMCVSWEKKYKKTDFLTVMNLEQHAMNLLAAPDVGSIRNQDDLEDNSWEAE